MRPSTSSTGRTSDVYATSKWIWGFGRRITDSEVIDRDAVEVAPRIPRHRCPGNSVRAVDLDRDGRAARNPPVCRRHPRARADGDAPRPAASVHVPDRVAWRRDGFGVVFRLVSAADRGARSRGDPVHGGVDSRRARRVPRVRLGPPTTTLDSALEEDGWARPELNRRSRLCKSRIITTRPRARGANRHGIHYALWERSVQVSRGRLGEPRNRRIEIGHDPLGRYDDHHHRASADFLDDHGRVPGLEEDAVGRRMSQFGCRRHSCSEDCRTHDRERLLRNIPRKIGGDDATISVDHGNGLRLRHVAEGADHFHQRGHVPPSCSNTHSRPPVLTHSTSANRTRCLVFASSSFERIPRSRWHVSTSPPDTASMEPRTRAPESVKETSSAQPRSRITFLPTSSGSSPRARLFVTSSARTIPSRKKRPWHAYDMTLS